MKKTIIIGSLLAVTLLASTAMAYQGNPDQPGPHYSPERHENMIKAIETKNYEAWKELMGDRGRVTQVINEDNFNLFAEAWQLMREGKFEEAAEIRQELGLGQERHQMPGQAKKRIWSEYVKMPNDKVRNFKHQEIGPQAGLFLGLNSHRFNLLL